MKGLGATMEQSHRAIAEKGVIHRASGRMLSSDGKHSAQWGL